MSHHLLYILADHEYILLSHPYDDNATYVHSQRCLSLCENHDLRTVTFNGSRGEETPEGHIDPSTGFECHCGPPHKCGYKRR